MVVVARLLLGILVALLLAAPVRAQMVNQQTGTSYIFVNPDCDPQGRKAVTFSNSSPVAVILPQAGGGDGFPGGCIINVVNLGAGVVTITPEVSTINGATSLVLPPNGWTTIYNTSIPNQTGNYIAQAGNATQTGVDISGDTVVGPDSVVRTLTNTAGIIRRNTGQNTVDEWLTSRGFASSTTGWQSVTTAAGNEIDISQAYTLPSGTAYIAVANAVSDASPLVTAEVRTGRDLYIPATNGCFLIHDVWLPAAGNSVRSNNGCVTAPYGSNFVFGLTGAVGNHLGGIRYQGPTVAYTLTPAVAGIDNLVRHETLASPAVIGATSVTLNPDATGTASIGATFTGNSSGTTTLAVSGLTGCLFAGDILTGTGITGSTTIASVTGGACTATSVTTAASTNVSGATVTDASVVLAVTNVTGGTIAQNQTILGTGLGTPPVIAPTGVVPPGGIPLTTSGFLPQTTTTCTTASSASPCVYNLINAQVILAGANSASQNVTTVIGVLANSQVLTGCVTPATPNGFTQTINTVGAAGASGIPLTMAGAVNSANGCAAVAYSPATVAPASIQTTGVQAGMRAEVLQTNGLFWPETVASISGLVATFADPAGLRYPSTSGADFDASFNSVYVGCNSRTAVVDPIVTSGWAGLFADCPYSNFPVYGLTVNSWTQETGLGSGVVIGRNAAAVTLNSPQTNMGTRFIASFSGNGSSTTFPLPYKMWSPAFLGVTTVKVGASAFTYNATCAGSTNWCLSEDGNTLTFHTAPVAGTNNVTASYLLIAGEALTFDGAGGGSTAGVVANGILSGGATVPCFMRGDSVSSFSSNLMASGVCGPGGERTFEATGGNGGVNIVANMVTNYGPSEIGIINGASVSGDFRQATMPADVAFDNLSGAAVSVDNTSSYGGMITTTTIPVTQFFQSANGITPAPAFMTGNTLPTPLVAPITAPATCTVGGSGPLPPGSTIVPCSAVTTFTTSVGNGAIPCVTSPSCTGIVTPTTNFMAMYTNVRAYDGANLVLTDPTTASITVGTVLGFYGPTQPAGGLFTSNGPRVMPLLTSQLPTCNSGTKGLSLTVSDATAPTFLGTLTGGGSVQSPVQCNSSNWVTY